MKSQVAKHLAAMLLVATQLVCVSRVERSVPDVSPTSTGEYQGEIILQVNDNWIGLNHMGGEILDFRLFKDGTIEFDDYPTAEEVQKFVWAKDVASRKRFVIEQETLSELKSIVESKTFRQLKNEYKKLTSSCDAANDRTIITKEKTIKIPQWCGKAEPPEFPKPIFDLFAKIRAIKAEKIGRYLPTP